MVDREACGELDQSRLAGGVGRSVGDADLAELRGDVDDGAAAGLAELRHRVFAHQERAGEIDGERLVPVVERERLDGAVRRHGGGDIHQRGEPAERLDGMTDCALGILLDRDIGADRHGLTARRRDLAATASAFSRLMSAIAIAAPASAKRRAMAPPISPTAAGDQRNAAA